jgi:hypothetical protein
MSVTAARLIVDRYAQQGCGSWSRTTSTAPAPRSPGRSGNDTRRYSFEKHPGVIDIGLGLAEARAMGLQDEEAPDAGPKARRCASTAWARRRSTSWSTDTAASS